MASLATTEKCPYCLQVTNQGQQLYGPICKNGHIAHLNCIMKQIEHTGSFNIDTWTCPLCRAPAFYDPNNKTTSLNDALRRRFSRRIAKLEERGEELGSGRISIDELSQQYPFLSTEYRENEQDYVMAIMNVLSRNVRMQGVFPHTSQFQDTVDGENMGAILLEQWYIMYNNATAYEDEGDMEDFHSTLSNQSDFFKMLTMALLLGYVSGFWNLDTDTFQLLTTMRRRAAEADGTRTVNFQSGGKRKKKTRRKRRRGGVGSQPTTPRKGPHKKPPLPLKRPKITFWEKKYRGENEEGITMNVMQHLTSMDLNDKEAEKEILEVLKYYLNDYKRIPENQQDPEFKKNLEKDITIFQNYVNNQSGGRRRKKKTRKKKGGMEEPLTPPRPPKDNDRGTNRYPPGLILPPPQVPVAQPQQVRMRGINREELTRDTPIGHRRPTQRMIDEHNERLRRSQNSRARNMAGDFLEACTGSRCGLGGRRRNKKTRKKRGGVKFGKNKTSAEIVKKSRELLKTTPQKKRIKRREQKIRLTGEQEFALFKKQALNQMRIAFIKSFGEPPSNMDKKILTLVYKFLKDEISKEETDFIEDYRAKNNENKRKLVWMNNSLRQLRNESVKRKHQIYNTGDDPDVIKKYRPRQRPRKEGPATGLVINTDKYMSPVKGPDTRYPKLSLDIGERSKSHKNLFKEGGRKKKTRKNKNKKRRTKKKSRRRR